MPFQRTEQVTRTAADETDHRTLIRFSRADSAATPPNHPRVVVDLYIARSDGKDESVRLDKRLADTTLTAGERSALGAILQKLAAEAAADAGFVNVQTLQGQGR